MWFFIDEPWQYRVLDCLPPGVDRAQLAQARAMSVSERVDAATALMEMGESLQRAVARKRAER